MIQAGQMRFVDLATEQEALAIVKYDAQTIGLVLSHAGGGDIEVRMNKHETQRLIELLNIAMAKQ